MKKTLLLLAVVLVLVSCKKLADGEYEITGNVKGMKKGTVYLEKQSPMGMGTQPVDTVKIIDGKFVIKGKTTEPEIHFMRVDKTQGGVQLILEGGKIEVTVDKDSIFKSKVKGTYNNDEFTKFSENYYKISKKSKKKIEEFEVKNKALIEEFQRTSDTAISNKLNAEFIPIKQEEIKI